MYEITIGHFWESSEMEDSKLWPAWDAGGALEFPKAFRHTNGFQVAAIWMVVF